jgi:DICT domain-containing protein
VRPDELVAKQSIKRRDVSARHRGAPLVLEAFQVNRLYRTQVLRHHLIGEKAVGTRILVSIASIIPRRVFRTSPFKVFLKMFRCEQV